MIDRPDNINIFILYAKADVALKQELEDHLGLLQRLGQIDVWHEGQIQPGIEKHLVIAEYLEKAHIILLLISANFLAPDHYMKYEAELRRAYERQEEGGVVIIPVILRHCVWQLDILASLSPLPSGGHPVRSDHWESVDKAFHDITVALQKVAHELKSRNEPALVSPEELQADTPIEKPVDLPEPYNPSDGAPDGLLNDLFDTLFSQSIEEALHRIKPMLHRSLLKHNALDPNFKKNNFDVAYSKIKQYVCPPEVLASKHTGRQKIGPRHDKDEGEEFVYTLKRIEDLGSMPGQVRIFHSKVDNSIKISGLSL